MTACAARDGGVAPPALGALLVLRVAHLVLLDLAQVLEAAVLRVGVRVRVHDVNVHPILDAVESQHLRIVGELSQDLARRRAQQELPNEEGHEAVGTTVPAGQ